MMTTANISTEDKNGLGFSAMSNDFQRISTTYRLLKELELSVGMIDELYTMNTSNNLPYHNFQHLLTVANRAVQGARYYNLSHTVQKALIIAGLCHDADYIVGEAESVNIPRAKRSAQQLCENFGIKKEITTQVMTLIDATEFPHYAVKTIEEQVIQDADLMQNLEEDCAKFLKGLCQEKNDDTIADPAFPTVAGFNTQWAKELYCQKFHTTTVL